jgi:hypothetical protein
MNCDKDLQSIRHIEHFASIALNRDCSFHQSLGCGRPEGDDESWTDGVDFLREPAPAYLDLACVGALMQPSLAARLELEIRHINAPAIDVRLRKGSVQQQARRPDKRTALEVFLVSWLFAYEHDLRVRRPFSEHGLGRVFPQWAGATRAASRRKLSSLSLRWLSPETLTV